MIVNTGINDIMWYVGEKQWVNRGGEREREREMEGG